MRSISAIAKGCGLRVLARTSSEQRKLFKFDSLDFFHDDVQVFGNAYKTVGAILRPYLEKRFGDKALFTAEFGAWSSDFHKTFEELGVKLVGEPLKVVWLPGLNKDKRIVICTNTVYDEMLQAAITLMNNDGAFARAVVGSMNSGKIGRLVRDKAFAELCEYFNLLD